MSGFEEDRVALLLNDRIPIESESVK